MPLTLRQAIDRQPEEISFDVAGMNNGRYLGPSETSRPVGPESTAGLDDIVASVRLTPEQARARLDALVKACDAGGVRSPFHKHKQRLVADLAPAYALFRFVQSDPDLAAMLRAHDALKDRVRKIPKSKIALMCLYCKMKPGSDDEKKSCSEWTAWLEQANHKTIPPEGFVDWAMGVSFKACRQEIRERRRVMKMPVGRSPDAAGRKRRLSLRETAEGADITLDGREFSIPKAVLEAVIATIERAAPEGLLASGNDNTAGDGHD